MTHEQARELLLDLAYGEVAVDDRRELEEHLAGCPECAAELAVLLSTREAAARLPEPGLPGGRAELVEAARRVASAPRLPRRPRWSRPAGWVAAATVVIVGGLTLKWLGEAPRRQEGMEEVAAVAPPAPSPATRPPATSAPAAPPAPAPEEKVARPATAPPAAAVPRSAAAPASRELPDGRGEDRAAAGAGPARTREREAPTFPDGASGAFVSLDLATGSSFRVNPDGCATRYSPFSTFKIPSSLIALETGVVKDPGERWGEVATRLGEPGMRRWLQAFRYGNEDVSGGIDRFWLGSSLRISPDEQVAFLAGLQRGRFPVAQRNLELVKEILAQEAGPGWRLVAATGSSSSGEGWLVGWVEKTGGGCAFALHLEASGDEEMARMRTGLARDLLRRAGCIPP